jgi:hypothetical protein
MTGRTTGTVVYPEAGGDHGEDERKECEAGLVCAGTETGGYDEVAAECRCGAILLFFCSKRVEGSDRARPGRCPVCGTQHRVPGEVAHILRQEGGRWNPVSK